MNIVHINIFPNKSTGNIMMKIHQALLDRNISSHAVFGRGNKSVDDTCIFMNDKLGVYYHALYTRMTDKTGFASKRSTQKLIQRLKQIQPDVIHLHNIHGYYINIEMLFAYIREFHIRVVWTFHDCWPITGHCAHFEWISCDKWKSKCFDCPLIHTYPSSYVDHSTWNYEAKKRIFSYSDLFIVTPCKWLASIVEQSFLKENSVFVIHNGIDKDIFHKTKSHFKKKYHLEDKKVILGLTNDWTSLKGYDDFLKLSKLLDPSVVIFLVGLSKKQLKNLPSNIMGIERTSDVFELVDIYNGVDLYFNPTYADTFPTTILEAIACETPVATYDTGGCKEMIDEQNGVITDFEDFSLHYMDYLNRTYSFQENQIPSIQNMVDNYLNLYDNLFNGKEKE